MNPAITNLDGGVCAVDGFKASGITAGLKPSGKPDMAVVAAAQPVAAAGVQTTNQVKAAPVIVTERHLANGTAQAVLLNAGSANVSTGQPGIELAEAGAATAANALGAADASDVLVCSTGVIGVEIPSEPYFEGAKAAVGALSRHGHTDAATAIMTTDLVPKEAAIAVEQDGAVTTIGGMVKGSGMIAPAMATMLCVITTDAPFGADVLEGALRQAVSRSFNRVSVDGCMSTNDAVLLLSTQAGDASGNGVDLATFTSGLTTLCRQLAELIVADGEGATRTLRIHVSGAASEDDAVAVGRQVGSSALVQTALAGGDPNWGRVIGAIGASRVTVDPERISIAFSAPGESPVMVANNGVAVPFDRAAAEAVVRKPSVECHIGLGLGDASADFLTCDLTHGYIQINAEYTT